MNHFVKTPGARPAARKSLLKRAMTAVNVAMGLALVASPVAIFAAPTTTVNAVCDYAGSSNVGPTNTSSSKCIYTDGAQGAVLSPYSGKITLPTGTTAIADEMAYHLTKTGWFTVAGTYQVNLLAVGTSTVLQTLNYTVNTDVNAYPNTVSATPATVQLAPAVLVSAAANGGQIGYVQFINQSIPFRAGDINTSKNEIWYYGANGSLLTQDATNSHPFTAPTGIPAPPPVVEHGALTGHIYDCTSGSQTTSEVTGGSIAASGPTPEAAAPNPISYPSVVA
ncbi:MAG: hypothetical protein ABR598_01170, partial [Candidatus Dormibacteria bacterium]